jgi:hypothetical protein
MSLRKKHPPNVFLESQNTSFEGHCPRLYFISSLDLHVIGVENTPSEVAVTDSHLQADGAVQIDHGATGSVLLLELGLIRFQHTDFPPSVKKQCDGGYPQDQYQQNY